MKLYKPSEHSETANVAPLVQFFELVHIGDTIQSMVQVYFEKELVSSLSDSLFFLFSSFLSPFSPHGFHSSFPSFHTLTSFLPLLLYSLLSAQAPHIDKTDFLNAVVREKKRFENSLDDSVAAGLNAGTEVLMNQVGWLVWLFCLLALEFPLFSSSSMAFLSCVHLLFYFLPLLLFFVSRPSSSLPSSFSLF